MKDNIALIGFMGSGKTTVGRALSKIMDMKFVDIDRVISAREKKSINAIFEEKGQQYFRDIERQIIIQESTKNNCVISTGGGSIIDNENLKNIKKTSYIVYLNCTIDCIYERLKNNMTRPILNQTETEEEKKKLIEDLYEKRKFLYEISADFSVEINKNSNVYETINKIKEAYINS
ncbi:MAG: shikimate kinase [Fusobacterium sp.]|nr:shikimate kinase [Fusobacterium sp.]